MTILEYPEWQKTYQAALVESDLEKLQQKILAAETAVFLRMHELVGRSNHSAERLAVQDALAGLRSLQTEKLKYPRFPDEIVETWRARNCR